MDILETIKKRHSVRSYDDGEIDKTAVEKLSELIKECNAEGDLNIQLVLNEPRAFDGFMARYGKFSGVKNYVALIGKKSACLDEKIGYYGEKIALFAGSLGLNTCWVALTYRKIKTAFTVKKGEKLRLVIAIGYGKTQGVPHVSKSIDKVCSVEENSPSWFIDGVESALLAPTAMNQQKFFFTLNGDEVEAKAGAGFYTKVDLGIVKYHFETAVGKENFKWKK